MTSTTRSAPDWSSLKSAIVVCGHAVYHGGPKLSPAHLATSDQHWFLQSFQKGEGKYFVSHVEAGVRLASEAKDSLLIFSGGQTRFPAILSEAQGYHDIAAVFDFWNMHDVRSRVTTEEFSRDSFDNVLFSIARFKECVGILPERLTIVSWAFKEARFEYHSSCIRWPQSRYRFVGVGVPANLKQAEAADERTLRNFEKDPSGYGNMDGNLGAKKNARNPYRRHHGYAASSPDMTVVLAWRGPTRLSDTDVPWC